MGRAVPLKWTEQSRIEKWAESSGPRSPGPKWFWAEESRNPDPVRNKYYDSGIWIQVRIL